jgi:hypothetical protein
MIEVLGKASDGFGKGLINGFIEAGEIIQITTVGMGGAVLPPSDHAGAEGAILGDNRHQIKAGLDPTHCVDFGGAVETSDCYACAPRFIGLLGPGLRGPHVMRCGTENISGVVAQGKGVYSNPGPDTPSKSFPLTQDGLEVVQNKVSKAHQNSLPEF